jgi:selenocysteine lyase/cysteine desulfurase
VVKPRPDGTYRVEDLEGGEAVALSAVQFGSGFHIDVRAVGALCKARKVPFALNVAQALGQVEIDASMGFDFLCGTSHKWMMGGYGVGLFYAREPLELPWAGWFSPPEGLRWQTFPGVTWDGPVARGVSLKTDASGLEAGGGHWPALYSFGAALNLIEAEGVKTIHMHNLELQRRLRDGLLRRGFEPNAPAMTGICVVRTKDDAHAACHKLLAEGVVVSPRAGGVRFSTHVYNDTTDIERALEAIDRAGLAPQKNT